MTQDQPDNVVSGGATSYLKSMDAWFKKIVLNNVCKLMWESQDAGSSELVMSRVTTPVAASYICGLDKRDEKSDDENEKKEDDLPLSALGTKQKKKRNEDTEAEGDDINNPSNYVLLAGIGNVKTFHLRDELLQFAKLDNKHV